MGIGWSCGDGDCVAVAGRVGRAHLRPGYGPTPFQNASQGSMNPVLLCVQKRARVLG